MATNKLSDRTIRSAPTGQHGDGGGLWLFVSDTGARRWVFRFTVAGRASSMGLGAYPAVSLADARQKARDARGVLAKGLNPIDERRKAQTAAVPTFADAARDYVSLHSSSWKHGRHAQQWETTITTYTAGIGNMPVDKISTGDVLAVLKPLWTRIPSTASRVRGRIELVLDAARARGLIDRDRANPARWRGHLDKLLPKVKTAAVTANHFAALPYKDMPSFMVKLRQRGGMSPKLMEFLILTAVRSGEARGAKWGEFDMETRVWVVPKERMKMGKAHTVPLSARAVELLEELRAGQPHAQDDDLVFRSVAGGGEVTASSLYELFKRLKRVDITVHGFRSTFRDWAGDETAFEREICEAALAHAVGTAAEQAYRRGNALEKRRALMQAWSEFVSGVERENVVKLRA